MRIWDVSDADMNFYSVYNDTLKDKRLHKTMFPTEDVEIQD